MSHYHAEPPPDDDLVDDELKFTGGGDGVVIFWVNEIQVDGVYATADGDHQQMQPLADVLFQHECETDPCGFDAHCDYVDSSAKAAGLPGGRFGDAYRWRPGYPVYTGKAATA